MSKPTGRIADFRAAEINQPSIGDGPVLSTGAVYKYVADINGPTMELPKRFDPTGGFIVQVQDKKTYDVVLQSWEIVGNTLAFYRPSFAPDKYRVVVMW